MVASSGSTFTTVQSFLVSCTSRVLCQKGGSVHVAIIAVACPQTRLSDNNRPIIQEMLTHDIWGTVSWEDSELGSIWEDSSVSGPALTTMAGPANSRTSLRSR